MMLSAGERQAAWRAVIAERHSPKAAARAAREHGLDLTKREIAAWNDRAVRRRAARLDVDPLVHQRNTRYTRLAAFSHRTQSSALGAQSERARQTLIAAARMARRMGMSVRSSKARDGRVSSYYALPSGGDRRRDLIRISDHQIPATATRDARADNPCGFGGFNGIEIIIESERNETWLRRALTLAAAGRPLPF